MTLDEKIPGPGDLVVAAFPKHEDAVAAKEKLANTNLAEVEVIAGSEATSHIEARAAWFADTDQVLQRYRQKLKAGYALLTAVVPDGESRQTIDETVREDADEITHFGQWVTESMKL